MSLGKALKHKLPKGVKVCHKYGAEATDGFPSKLEKAVHAILLLREAANEICNIRRQERVELTVAKIPCKIDFAFDVASAVEGGCLFIRHYAEAKGIETERWRMIKKLWRSYGPGELEIWVAGRNGEPYLQETIRP